MSFCRHSSSTSRCVKGWLQGDRRREQAGRGGEMVSNCESTALSQQAE